MFWAYELKMDIFSLVVHETFENAALVSLSLKLATGGDTHVSFVFVV